MWLDRAAIVKQVIDRSGSLVGAVLTLMHVMPERRDVRVARFLVILTFGRWQRSGPGKSQRRQHENERNSLQCAPHSKSFQQSKFRLHQWHRKNLASVLILASTALIEGMVATTVPGGG